MPIIMDTMKYVNCPVCNKKHFTIATTPLLKYRFCHIHQKLFDAGYIFIIGIDEDTSNNSPSLDTINRLDKFVYISLAEYFQCMTVPLPENAYRIVFASDELIDLISDYINSNNTIQ